MTIKGKDVTQSRKRAKAALAERHGFAECGHTALVAAEDPATREFLARGLSALGVGTVVLGSAGRKPAGRRKGKKSRKPSAEALPEIANVAWEDSLGKDGGYAFDFVIWDDRHAGLDLVGAVSRGAVPVLPEKNAFSGEFRQFDPMNFEGNAFIYREENPFLMFAAAVAYLENSKFPEDRRILLKNVLKTF